MLVTKKLQYALIALGHLYNNIDERCNVKKIAEQNKLSLAFTSLIMGELKIAGIVDSKKGPGGGYKPIFSPEDLSLNKISLAIKEPLNRPVQKTGSKVSDTFNENLQRKINSFSESTFASLINIK